MSIDDKYAAWQRLVATLLTPEEETERYEIVGVIGEGGFGEVSKVRRKSDNVLLAMKKIKFNTADAKNDNLRREIFNILTTDRHENIVQWTDIFRTKTHLCIVMELCNMDLTNFMEVPSNRNYSICLDVAKQIAKGIVFLHNRTPSLVHRDIKPENILIIKNHETTKVSVKIADFGLSSVADFTSIPDNATHSNRIRSSVSSIGVHGTKPFMAPEMFAAEEGHGLVNGRFRAHVSGDVFAMGLVYAYVFFYTDSEYVSLIRQHMNASLGYDMYEAQKDSTEIPTAVDFEVDDSQEVKGMKQLINDMTSFDPNQRPSSEQVLERIKKAQSKPGRIQRKHISVASVVVVLLAMTAFIFVPNEQGGSVWKSATSSLLSIAVGNGYCACVGFLVHIGADVNAVALEFGSTPLHTASERGDVDCLYRLITMGANVDARTRDQRYTPLHVAVLAKNSNVVRMLIVTCNASTDAEDAEFYKPLHLAAKHGHTKIIQTLLSYSDVDVNTETGQCQETALHLAAANGHVSCVEVLMKHGANVEAEDCDENRPLMFAARHNQVNALKTLIEDYHAHINAENKFGSTALYFATRHCNADSVELLLSYPDCIADFESRADTPLHVACEKGSTPCLNFLIKHGASVESRDIFSFKFKLPLQYDGTGIYRGEVVDSLIDAVAADSEVTSRISHKTHNHYLRNHDGSALNTFIETSQQSWCSGTRRVATIDTLMKHGANVNVRDQIDNRPLHYCVGADCVECVETLIFEYNAHMNAADRYGHTALHKAVSRRDVNMIQSLLSHPDCDVNAEDNIGQSALHIACTACNTSSINILIKYGAEVDATDDYNSTPLHVAARLNRTDCARAMLKNNASVDVVENDGYTALHHAAEQCNVEIIRMLASNPNCDVNARNERGRSALYIAAKHGCVSGALMTLGAYIADDDN